MNKITRLYRIEEGILAGTEIEPIMGLVCVKYPHRKSKDLYVPPMKIGEKEVKTWHCCQAVCSAPDFEGGIDALIEHLILHKGRLLKPWSKKLQLQSPIPAVKLPPNPWLDKPKGGVIAVRPGGLTDLNEDRRFCLDLYIGDVKRWLQKQGIEIVE